jgi:hypothetical protein
MESHSSTGTMLISHSTASHPPGYVSWKAPGAFLHQYPVPFLNRCSVSVLMNKDLFNNYSLSTEVIHDPKMSSRHSIVISVVIHK